MINHKLTPLLLDKDANIWMALCVVSLSPNDKPGNIMIRKHGQNIAHVYNIALNRWGKQKMVQLNMQEHEILILSAKGFTIAEIAHKMYLSFDTIKFHRKKIYKKLQVKSISEAIAASANLSLV